ncbi:MAG: EAL domain-containing protein, partial [Pseudomonadota bacterium]
MLLDPELSIIAQTDAMTAELSPDAIDAAIAQVAALQGDTRNLEHPCTARDGTLRRFLWTKAADGSWLGLLAHPDKDAAPVLQAVDELTGLERRSGLQGAYEALRVASARAEAIVFALYIDLDRFKQVNDWLGHEAGDLLLKRVAQRLGQASRNADRLFRIGGDEFALLGSAQEGVVAATDIAERIVDVIERPFVIKGNEVSIGASVGIAVAEAGDGSAEDLLRRADVALYVSKNTGRGRFTLFEHSMMENIKESRLLENDLRRALLLDQFVLHFQPQIAVDGGQLTGFEALLRWQRPEHGLLTPADFMDLADRTRLIVDIGAWVLQEATSAATRWPDHLSVAVNVSAVQFENPQFPKQVQSALSESGLDPARLELELTEAMITHDQGKALAQMRALHELGVGISLDDLGRGSRPFPISASFPSAKSRSTNPLSGGRSMERMSTGSSVRYRTSPTRSACLCLPKVSKRTPTWAASAPMGWRPFRGTSWPSRCPPAICKPISAHLEICHLRQRKPHDRAPPCRLFQP